jgi:hypothetical protein
MTNFIGKKKMNIGLHVALILAGMIIPPLILLMILLDKLKRAGEK